MSPPGPSSSGSSEARGRPPARDLGHLSPSALPLALAELHRGLLPGASAVLHLPGPATDPPVEARGGELPAPPDAWAADLLVGAGFAVRSVAFQRGRADVDVVVHAERAVSLPDTVGPDMRVLIVGSNPSPTAATTGVGYSGPGNRFWPAAQAAGLISGPRHPHHALTAHGMGMTDLVKRTTPRASELSPDEIRQGLTRVERLVGWLRPGAVCVVGLAGWRVAADRRARPGQQSRALGGVPVYLMPSTSGLNTRVGLDELRGHLAAAAALADRALADGARGRA